MWFWFETAKRFPEVIMRTNNVTTVYIKWSHVTLRLMPIFLAFSVLDVTAVYSFAWLQFRSRFVKFFAAINCLLLSTLLSVMAWYLKVPPKSILSLFPLNANQYHCTMIVLVDDCIKWMFPYKHSITIMLVIWLFCYS